MIRIRALRKGFRRCGIAHSDQFTDYPDDAFTKDQLEALLAEPMLQVRYVDDIDDDLDEKPKSGDDEAIKDTSEIKEEDTRAGSQTTDAAGADKEVKASPAPAPEKPAAETAEQAGADAAKTDAAEKSAKTKQPVTDK